MNKKAPLAELLAEYETLPARAAEVNYADADSIKAYNKAVKRMHTLAARMARDYDLKGAKALGDLLENTAHNGHRWAAQHLLEHFNVDQQVGERALAILEKAAEGDSIEAMGYQAWLHKYYAQGEEPGEG